MHNDHNNVCSSYNKSWLLLVAVQVRSKIEDRAITFPLVQSCIMLEKVGGVFKSGCDRRSKCFYGKSFSS